MQKVYVFIFASPLFSYIAISILWLSLNPSPDSVAPLEVASEIPLTPLTLLNLSLLTLVCVKKWWAVNTAARLWWGVMRASQVKWLLTLCVAPWWAWVSMLSTLVWHQLLPQNWRLLSRVLAVVLLSQHLTTLVNGTHSSSLMNMENSFHLRKLAK